MQTLGSIPFPRIYASMMELVDMKVSKTFASDSVWVRVSIEAFGKLA